jgi:hypothetical protein
MADTLDDFQSFRSNMNDLILGKGNLTINRFFALDSRAYEAATSGGRWGDSRKPEKPSEISDFRSQK